MDKTAALTRLNALESEAQALRKILEAPEPAASLLTKPEPGNNDTYWAVGRTCGPTYSLSVGKMCATERDLQAYSHGNLFQSKELAQAYAEAIDTMLLLRHQPGTVPAADLSQVYINTKDSGARCNTATDSNIFSKMYRLSPCFAIHEQAQAAIDVVGEQRILRMFKTFHHVS